MQISVGTVDNRVYHSDYMTRAEVMESENLTEDQLDAQIEGLNDYFNNFESMDSVTVKMSGKDFHFNPANIVWIQFRPEDK